MKHIEWYIGITVYLIIVGGLIYLGQSWQAERDEIKDELDIFCISKGYDEATSHHLKEFADNKFVHCKKEIVTIDDNGIAEFETIYDDIVFTEGKDK